MNGFTPQAENHKSQAEHNYEFIQQIDRGLFQDWFITVCFYMALHYVDAHAILRNIAFENQKEDEVSPHIKRLRYVRRNLPQLYLGYNRLYNESRSARYDPLYFRFFKGDLDKHLELALEFRRMV